MPISGLHELEQNKELGGSSKVIKRMENKSLEERIKEMGNEFKGK